MKQKIIFAVLFFVALNAITKEVLVNADLKKWPQGKSPTGWFGGQKELSIVIGNKNSSKLTGNVAQMVQRIKLRKDKYYRISGNIYKGGGASYGQIGIRTAKYKWLFTLKGSKNAGEWQKVSGVYKANGSERYFYCINWYMGKYGACYFSSLSIAEISPDKAKKAVNKK